MAIDFGRTAGDFRAYRAGFPDEFFRRIAAHGIGRPGQRLLDLGTGTGTLARGFAGLGCRVVGLDIARPLMREAREMDRAAGVTVSYLASRAETAGLTPGTFDVVTAGQAWHWFDRPRAAAEVWRLLRPGGLGVIAHFDWLPLPGNVVEATEALIVAHNPRWKGAGGRGIHPRWFDDLALAGFADLESFTFDVDVPYSHEAWRGRVRASGGIAAWLAPDAVARFDAELGELLKEKFPADPVHTPHRVFAVWGRRREGP